MLRIVLPVIAILITLAHAQAAELLMFTQQGCAWCEKFDREIAQLYRKTTEGRRAPLRRVDIAKPLPRDLAFVQRERFTPVFILIENGREFGRIRGYPGDAFFFGLLDNMIAQLDRGESVAPDPSVAPPAGATIAK